MEIRRFGPGHRRPDGPPGTRGVTGQVIHSDARGVITELAFGPRAMIAPHSNPNTTFFIVISGGGFIQVGDERTRINHGEAVVWPAGVAHGAYTEGSEMRAIIVELSGPDDALARGILEGKQIRTGLAARQEPDRVATIERGRGRLAERTAPETGETGTGEPW